MVFVNSDPNLIRLFLRFLDATGTGLGRRRHGGTWRRELNQAAESCVPRCLPIPRQDPGRYRGTALTVMSHYKLRSRSGVG